MDVHFNALPRQVREQIVAALTPAKHPAVIARRSDVRRGWINYVGLLLSVPALGFVLSLRPEPRAIELFAVLAGLTFLFWMSLISVILARARNNSPIGDGLYLFTSGVVKVKDGALTHTALSSLKTVQLETVLKNNVYQHTLVDLGWHKFKFDRRTEAAAAVSRLQAVRAAAVPSDDPFALLLASEQWAAPETGGSLHPKGTLMKLVRFPGALIVAVAVAAAMYAISTNG